VLLVVGHPSIGAALETLLQIEDRYEVRRAQSLEVAGAGLEGWNADLALVDGVLVQTGRTEALTMPAIVLSGNAADGKRLSSRLTAGRGWLRKDATSDELRVAIDRAIAGGGPRARPTTLAGLALAGALIVAAVLAVAWYVFGVRG
jgi:DNA-binding NarL/FixJ family response regulator